MTTNNVIELGCIFVGVNICLVRLAELWRERPEQVRRFITHLSSFILASLACTAWLLIWVPLVFVFWLAACFVCNHNLNWRITHE